MQKIRQINSTKSSRYFLKYKNIIPLIALTGFGIYSYSKRRKSFIYKTIKFNIPKSISNYFYNFLLSDEIKQNSISLVNNIFTHSSTKKALGELIKGALDDKDISMNIKSNVSFMMTDFIKDKSIKEQLIRTLIVAIQNKEIKKESMELVKEFFDYPKTQEVFIAFVQEVSMKEEIKQMFTRLVMDSAIMTMKMSETKKKGAEFIADIWSDPVVRWNMFKRSILFWKSTSPSSGSLNNNNKNNGLKH